MNRRAIATAVAGVVVVASCRSLPPVGTTANAPAADHHQHLFGPDVAAVLAGTNQPQGITARDLIARLDSAGIRRALVLSVAYTLARPGRNLENEHARVRAENDWTAAQAAQYPDRLRAFCSFNPMSAYALEELERCAQTPGLRRGIKLHFGNSDVQVDDPAHLEQLRRVFRAANAHRMAIVVHMRASISLRRPYGASQARTFLDSLLPSTPDVPVQIAHLAGAGGYDDPAVDSAMAVLADAVGRSDPRTRHLWFDVTSVATNETTAGQAALIVRRIREIGPSRILYGSDAPLGGNLSPREGWAAFRKLPLTDTEFATIARNVAPYLR